MKKFKTINLILCSVLLLTSIPAAANTNYSNSTYSTENQEIESGTHNTTVYAEIQSEFKVTIPKKIVLDGDSKTGNYTVTVEGDIAGKEVIKVIPDSTVTLQSKDKPSIFGTIIQDKVNWTYNEILNGNNVLGTGFISAPDMTAGSWNGTFNFNISLTESSISVKSENLNGVDLNATAENIVNNEKEFLLDELQRSGLADKNNVSAIVKVESDEFDEMAKTTFDVSEIATPGDTIVILHYNEETKEWEYVGTEIVSEDGTVTVYMSSYSPVAFVELPPEHKHEYNLTTVEATCKENGLNTYRCVCGEYYKEEIMTSGHNWAKDYTVDIRVFCTIDGSKSIHCTNCDAKKDIVVIPAPGHDYSEWKTINNSTCTSKGYEERQCFECGKIENKNLDLLEHNWNEEYTIDKEPDCITEGSRSIHCQDCEAIKDSEVLAALGHVEVIDEGIDATCTDKGLTEGKHCNVCKEILVKQETIEATGHHYKQIVTDATCTEIGYTTHKCYDCDDSYITDEINPTGHDYETSITKEATCTTDGNRLYDCKNCEHKYNEKIEAKGHIFDATKYTTDKLATCTTDGQKSVHCNTCGTINTTTITVIPAFGHNFENYITTKEPTCTENGEQKATCTNCHQIDDVIIIEKLGHNYLTEYIVDKEPTCTETGSESQHCLNCEEVRNITEIPALGHMFENETCTSCERTKEEIFNYIFEYTGEIQEFVVPTTGIYLLETWGAQNSESELKGEYSTGEIALNEGDVIYIYVGGQKDFAEMQENEFTLTCGYGATYITLKNELLVEFENSKSDIVIVAGSTDGLGYIENVINGFIESENREGNGVAKISYISSLDEYHIDNNNDTFCDFCNIEGTVVYNYHNHENCQQTSVETDYGTTITTKNIICGLEYTEEPSETGDEIDGQPTYNWQCSESHNWNGLIDSCPDVCPEIIDTITETTCNHCNLTSCNGIHIEQGEYDCNKTEETVESQYIKFE